MPNQSSELPRDDETNQSQRKHINKKLFMGLAIALVGISGAGLLAFQWFGAQIKQNTEENLLAIAKLKSYQIETWLNERKADAFIFAGRPSVRFTITNNGAVSQDAVSESMEMTMKQAIIDTKAGYGYQRVVLLDLQGKIVRTNDESANIPVTVATTFQQKIKSASDDVKPELIDLNLIETSQGKKAIYGILATVYDQKKSLIGAVYFEADPERFLFPFLKSWPTSSNTAETLLVRKEDKFMRYLSPLRHRNDDVLEATVSLDKTNIFAVMAIQSPESEVVRQSFDYRGIPILAASIKVKGTPWTMISKIDLEEANAPLQRLAFTVSSLTILLIGVMLYVTCQVRRSGKLEIKFAEEMAARERAQMIAANASRYVTAIETSIDGYVMIDRDGKFIEVNQSLEEITGYSAEQLLSLSMVDLVVSEDFQPEEFVANILAAKKQRLQQKWKHQNGDIIDVQIGVSYLKKSDGFFFIFVQDLTNLLKIQCQLERTQKLYAFLSHANEAIVRIPDPQKLLSEICQIAIAHGEFQLAWIGLVNPETQLLDVTAAAGEAVEYIKDIHISVNPDLAIAYGPAGTAIREKKVVLVNDYFNDPTTLPWQENALKNIIKGCVALPFQVNNQTEGAIMFYASETDFFSEDVINLLIELTEDVCLSLRLAESEKSRRQTEAALLQSEERFRLAIINAPFPVLLYSSNFRPLQINRAWINQSGHADRDIMEVTAWTDRFCAEQLSLLSPVEDKFNHRDGDLEGKEISIITADRSPRIWRFDTSLLTDINVPKPIMIGMAIDITEQKRIEVSLQDSEERLRRAITDAPLPIILHAADGEVLQLNRLWTELSGYTITDIPTIDEWAKRAYGESYVPVKERIDKVYEITEATHDGEYELFAKDGSTKIWDFSSAPLGNLADGRQAIITMAMDVSDRKANEIALAAAKEQAETASQAKSDFLASMSHELRTPLNGILGYAQVLLCDPDATTKQIDGLAVIEQCGKHLLDLISEILDLAKIEAQKLDLFPKQVSLSEVLVGVTQICRLKSEEKNLLFLSEFSDRLPSYVLVDEQRLRQILLNLLGNAIKFTDHGQVTLSVDLAPLPSGSVNADQSEDGVLTHTIRFAIEDTGRGIDSENLEKLFLPFEQVGDRRTRPEGTGLGLAISQKLVTMMGGLIKVESELNQGSRFWFDLELPEVDAIICQTTKGNDSNSYQKIKGYHGKKLTILAVDDRWINRAVIRQLLEPLGFNVLEADNGLNGIKVVQTNSVDLIITDILMPKLDGLDMTRRLKAITEFQHIPILAHSASIIESERIKSDEAGCDDFLTKPIEATKLLDQLKKYLQLTWIYEEVLPVVSESEHQDSHIVIPPASEIKAIFEALDVGDFHAIEQEAQRINQLAPEYQSFANKLRNLAQSFDEQSILQLLEAVNHK